MRKRTVFGIVMLLLVSLMSLMPVVKAKAYWWDGIRFVEGYEGEWIDYPHPDRVYYGISPSSTKGVDGNKLHHCQIDSATSVTLVYSAVVLCSALGAYLGGKLGSYGAVAGFVIGLAFGVFITYVSEVYFLDEHNCIWWWLSLAFMNWVFANAFWLWYYGSINPSYATSLVVSQLYTTGYIRVGAITFLDAIGVGNPANWVSPTGYIDQTGTWEWETSAYDEDVYTGASQYPISPQTWSHCLILTVPQMVCDRIRFCAPQSLANIQIYIDVYRDGAWINVYNGAFKYYDAQGKPMWNEKGFSQGTVSQARVLFYSPNPYFEWMAQLYEFDFKDSS